MARKILPSNAATTRDEVAANEFIRESNVKNIVPYKGFQRSEDIQRWLPQNSRIPCVQETRKKMRLTKSSDLTLLDFELMDESLDRDVVRKWSNIAKQKVLDVVAIALIDLASLDIAHTDIRLPNVFVKNGQFYLGDFSKIKWESDLSKLARNYIKQMNVLVSGMKMTGPITVPEFYSNIVL